MPTMHTMEYGELAGTGQMRVNAPLQIIPSSDPLAYTEVDVSTTAITHTLATGCSFVEIHAGDNDIRIRRLTATDEADCTASNAHHRGGGGTVRHYGVKDGALSLSILALGDGTATIIEY